MAFLSSTDNPHAVRITGFRKHNQLSPTATTAFTAIMKQEVSETTIKHDFELAGERNVATNNFEELFDKAAARQR